MVYFANHFQLHICLVPSKTNCIKEGGFCALANGFNQNSGVIQLDSLGGNSEERHQECLEQCLAYPNATGCELIFFPDQGCYVHTESVSRTNGASADQSCWIFSKCKRSK